MNLRIGMGRFTAIAFALTAGTTLVAQSTGALSGVVKDAKGTPIAQARVTLTSPQMQGARVVTTNQAGEWRAPLLPVGNYRVAVDKDGWVGSRADGVRVGLGTSIRQDLVMKPIQQQAAVVEVVATAAEVDKSETKTATNFSADQLAVLPGAGRSFAGAADLSAGLATGVNGSFSVRGGATQNTQYRVNGTDVKDDYQGDLTGTYVIEDNIEDVQVILSPLNARNGRALGGAVNVVTKSGSNTFAGSIRGTFQRTSWLASTPYSRAQGGGQTSDDLNKEYQVTLSGPILKDRLWFSAGTILKPSQSFDYNTGINYASFADAPVLTGWYPNVDNVLFAGPAGYQFTKFQEEAPYKQKYDDTYWEGKLTGAITQNHTVEFSYSKSKVTLGPRNPFGDGSVVSRVQALGEQSEDKQSYGWNYRGLLAANMFIEARLNKIDSRVVFPYGDASGNYGTGEAMLVYQGATLALDYGIPGYRAGYSYPFGLGISPRPDRRNNRSGGVNFTLYLDAAGSHEIDTGFEFYKAVRGTSRQAGERNLIFRVGGAYQAISGADAYLFPTVNFDPSLIDDGIQDASGLRGPAASVVQYTGVDGTTENTTKSVYVNDQWTINSHWNVMAGLRYDKMDVVDTTGQTLGDSSDISPRLQVRFDPIGDSRYVYTFTGARYNGDFTTGFTDAFIQKADGRGVYRAWDGNPYGIGDAADPTGLYGVRFYDYAGITDLANYGYVIDYFDNSQSYSVASDLKAPVLDEFTLSFRRGWENGSFAKVTLVHREWKKDWAFAVDYHPDYLATVADPTGSGLPSRDIIQTRIFNSDELTRKYNGLELEWKGVINRTWTMGGNWTFSRLVGNNNGGDQGAGGQTFRDNSPAGYYFQRLYLTQVMGLSDSVFAPEGPLVQDQAHRGRLWLSAVMPLGKGTVSYSFLMRYDSGNHFNTASAAAITPAIPVITTANGDVAGRPTTYTNFYGGRGQYSTNDTYRYDFKLNFQVPLGLPGFASRLMLIGDVQVNNLFNTQLVTSRELSLRNTTTGSDYLGIQDPSLHGTIDPNNGNYWMNGRTIQASLGLKF